MRNRYFSPESSLIKLDNSNNNQHRLRMVGSTTKLLNLSSYPEERVAEKKIGSYSYDTSKEIGSGYSSKVYKAIKNDTSAEYAIKVIDLQKYSASSLEMLDSEIKILKALNHPNVIKCYDVYKTSTHCFIVTELCSSGDLLTYLTFKGKLQENVAIEIMAQVIEGLKYLLTSGILHRDLKPANILYNQKHWKIADFGFAIYSEAEIKTRCNVGTPLYMPPEALITNIYSPQSDIFSMGVIFFELLTGITPWESKSEKELIKKMTTLPFHLSSRHQISPSTREILSRFCEVDLQKRYTKEQFFNLNIRKEENLNNPEEHKKQLQSSKRTEVNVSEIREELIKSTSSIHLLQQKSFKSIDNSQQTDRTDTKNNHILINQLHYCRFLYYMTRNIHLFMIHPKNKVKITLILYKHLQKLIKHLADSNKNWFLLKNWDNFKESRKYNTTHLTMKQYSGRYEKQYLNFLKSAQLNIIREINKELSQLSTNESFSINLFKEMSCYVSQILREFNHNLMLEINKAANQINTETRGSIEAIKQVHKYYQLLQMSMQDFENFEKFEKCCEIKVQIDYKTTSNATLQDYLDLRAVLKGI